MHPFLSWFMLCAVLSGCQPADKVEIVKHINLYESPATYSAWPSIERAANGDLLIVYTNTERHVSPDGAIVMQRSTDNGKTWSTPEVIFDTVIDDRQSGLMVLEDGRILANYWSTHFKRKDYETTYAHSYHPDTLARWIETVEQPAYLGAIDLHGGSLAISSDHGRTWSPTVRAPETIHGGIELQNGQLLIASYRENDEKVGLYHAPAPEGPWTLTTTVASPRPDSIRFGEPHILQLPSGRIIMMIRATAKPYNDQHPDLYLWESYSDDNGQTWSAPFETPMWGLPPHLTLLHDGRVLCTYGYRRAPYGQRAIISEDGITWHIEDEIILRDDAPRPDLGYPASIELDDAGTILSVYYQVPDSAGMPYKTYRKPDMLATFWRVPGS